MCATVPSSGPRHDMGTSGYAGIATAKLLAIEASRHSQGMGELKASYKMQMGLRAVDGLWDPKHTFVHSWIVYHLLTNPTRNHTVEEDIYGLGHLYSWVPQLLVRKTVKPF